MLERVEMNLVYTVEEMRRYVKNFLLSKAVLAQSMSEGQKIGKF